tara:strand:+ start:7338 stop:8798 length:1461 start_codon:yes stop_codon:yes gene_type:complete
MLRFDSIQFPKGVSTRPVDAVEHKDSLYTCCLGLSITKWSKSMAKPIAKLSSHTAPIMQLIIHDDHLFSCSWDNTIKMWDLETNECVKTLHHTSSIYAICASNHKIYAGDANGNLFYCYYKKQTNLRLLYKNNVSYIIEWLFIHEFKKNQQTYKYLYSIDMQGIITRFNIKTNAIDNLMRAPRGIHDISIWENKLYMIIGDTIRILDLMHYVVPTCEMQLAVPIKSLFVKDGNIYGASYDSFLIYYWSQTTVSDSMRKHTTRTPSDRRLSSNSEKIIIKMIQTSDGMCISYSDGSISLWIPSTCLMCCNLLTTVDTSNCNNCKTNICHVCMSKWLGMNKVGHCIKHANFSCPSCRQIATYRMFSKVYSDRVVRQMAFCTFEDDSYYAWCERCYKVEACMKKSCSSEQPAISHYQCEECTLKETTQTSQMMEAAKHCANCKHTISKVAGCNHIKCVCGAHWCYVCEASFKTSSECCNQLHTVHGGLF